MRIRRQKPVGSQQENVLCSSCRLLSTVCLLLFVFCSLPTVSAASWTRQPSGTMAFLHSVYFLDQNRGWAAGSNGTLLQTTDGGATWKKLALTRDTIRDVYFANQNVGWILCERDPLKLTSNSEPRSYLLKTEDGGSSWRVIFFNSESALLRAVFVNTQYGWVFGESGVVFATRDAGAHWIRQASSTKHLLLGGTFFDYNHLWLVGSGATILQTSDGGLSWRTAMVPGDASMRFTSASFVGSFFGWAVGNSGRVFRTSNGGRSWLLQKTNVDADLLDVKFIGSEGWAVGRQGTMVHTKDAGGHWVVEATGTSHDLQRVFFVDQSHGWAVGFGGTILKYGERTAPQLLQNRQ